MKLDSLFFRVIIALVMLTVLSFFNGLTKIAVQKIATQFSITISKENNNIITLILYLIVGTISLVIIIKDNQYLEENYEVSFLRKITASMFRLIGMVSIFYIIFSLYMMLK